MTTTTIGSFPKPVEIRRARWQHSEGEIEEAALREVEDRALESTLRAQEELGLDLLVDGQLDRSDMVTFFAEKLEGFEIGGFVRCWGNRYYRKPRLVGEVGRADALSVDRWRTAQQRAGRPVKAIVTGPYTLMDWSFDEHYRSRKAACTALAEVIRAEVADLAAAGATEIQLDEPAIGARPEEMELVHEAIALVTRDVREQARIWLYAGYGDLKPVMGQLLGFPVDALLLEMAHSEYAALDAIAGLPPEMLLGGGVVDAIDPRVETADEIQLRIERLQRVVPAERLVVTPDAGLRTLTAGQAEGKLRAMVTAARTFSNGGS
jgi:5-methyltetrahydropteroyltriglutamate--homocysteine methyltransferase